MPRVDPPRRFLRCSLEVSKSVDSRLVQNSPVSLDFPNPNENRADVGQGHCSLGEPIGSAVDPHASRGRGPIPSVSMLQFAPF